MGFIMPKTVGIVARLDRQAAVKLAGKISHYLASKGLNVLVESELARLQVKGKAVALNKMLADLLIVLGGDGTILRTCMNIPIPETPILGINMGTWGFLTDVKPESTLEAIKKCLAGDYITEECTKLSLSVNGGKLPDGLNEVVVTSTQPIKMLYLKISVDGVASMKFGADGIIVSTPLGSTAYSYAAGGPAVDSRVSALILTLLNPLTPTRSMVIPATSTIRIELLKPRSKAAVIVDGAYQREITFRQSLVVKKSNHTSVFIRLRKDFFQRRLRGRALSISWGR